MSLIELSDLQGRSSLLSSPIVPDLTDRIIRQTDQYCEAGGFGDVFRCWYTSDDGVRKEVAVKAFRFSFTFNEQKREGGKVARMIRRELGIWKRLSHRNIVPFLGIAFGFGRQGSAALVSLWMPHGALHTFLEAHDDQLGVTHRLQLLWDIASGLQYLHSFSLVHGDLSSNNVLLDRNYNACLSDFGCASLVGEHPQGFTYLKTSTMRPGALRWTAPEQLNEEEAKPSIKSDIYSFGNIGLLVLSGKFPWSEIRADAAVVLRLSRGIKPSRPLAQPIDDRHWELIEQCWSSIPERPVAKDIVSSLQQLLDDYPGPLPLRVLLNVPTPSSGVSNSNGDLFPDYLGLHNIPPDSMESSDRLRVQEIQDHEHWQRDREPERPVEVRRSKRLKMERKDPDHYSPSLVPGPTPKLSAPVGPPISKLPPPPSVRPLYRRDPENPPPSGPPEPPPASSSLAPVNNTSNDGQFPDDLNPHNIPPELKKEGSDWFAVFNPKVMRVLDVALMHTLMHESVVLCVRFSADGKFLATGCNRTAQIYDTKTGTKTCVLADETAGKAGDLYIRSVCFSPDGKYLVTSADDKRIRIWDIAKKRIRHVFDGHQQEVYSLDFSLDGRLIVSGSGDKTARIWDMVDGSSKVLTINDPDSLNNDAGVTSVAISPNGQLVAAGSLDTVVRIWDVASGMLIERLRGHRDSVYSVAFTPDGKGLVSGSLDKTLKYWDVSGLMNGTKRKYANANSKKKLEKSSQCTMNFMGHTDYVLSVAVSHDGQWVVSGSKDRGVQFWDSHSATVQCMLRGHKNSVISVDLSPAGNILATGSGDWQARIWSYETI